LDQTTITLLLDSLQIVQGIAEPIDSEANHFVMAPMVE